MLNLPGAAGEEEKEGRKEVERGVLGEQKHGRGERGNRELNGTASADLIFMPWALGSPV